MTAMKKGRGVIAEKRRVLDACFVPPRHHLLPSPPCSVVVLPLREKAKSTEQDASKWIPRQSRPSCRHPKFPRSLVQSVDQSTSALAVGAALKFPEINRVFKDGRGARRGLESLQTYGEFCIGRLEEFKSEVNRLHRPGLIPGDLYVETRELIRYSKYVVRGLMEYHQRYRVNFWFRCVHWMAFPVRSRTELFERRLQECALWVRIASATSFLRANFYDAWRGIPGVREICQARAQQLREDIAQAEKYSEKYPTRFEKHLGRSVRLRVLRRHWYLAYEPLFELPRSPLSTPSPSPHPWQRHRNYTMPIIAVAPSTGLSSICIEEHCRCRVSEDQNRDYRGGGEARRSPSRESAHSSPSRHSDISSAGHHRRSSTSRSRIVPPSGQNHNSSIQHSQSVGRPDGSIADHHVRDSEHGRHREPPSRSSSSHRYSSQDRASSRHYSTSRSSSTASTTRDSIFSAAPPRSSSSSYASEVDAEENSERTKQPPLPEPQARRGHSAEDTLRRSGRKQKLDRYYPPNAFENDPKKTKKGRRSRSRSGSGAGNGGLSRSRRI